MLDRLDAAGGALGGLLATEEARHLGRLFGGEHGLVGGAGLATVPVVAHVRDAEASEQSAHAVSDLAIVFTHGVLLREALRVETVEVHTQLPLHLEFGEDLGEHERERLRGLLREPIGLGGVGPTETSLEVLVHILVVLVHVVAETLRQELLRVLRAQDLRVLAAERELRELLHQETDELALHSLVLRRGLLVLVEALEHRHRNGCSVREAHVVGLHELVAEDEQARDGRLLASEGRDRLQGLAVSDRPSALDLGDGHDFLLPCETDELVVAVLQVVEGLRAEDLAEIDLSGRHGVFSVCG